MRRFGATITELPTILHVMATSLAARVGPFARDSERFVIRLLLGGTEKPR
jgi:hypothetical protein